MLSVFIPIYCNRCIKRSFWGSSVRWRQRNEPRSCYPRQFFTPLKSKCLPAIYLCLEYSNVLVPFWSTAAELWNVDEYLKRYEKIKIASKWNQKDSNNAFKKIVILLNKYVSHGFDKTLTVIWVVYQKHHITVWVRILWTPTIPNPILESQDMQSCSLLLMMLILAFAPFSGYSTEPLITLNPSKWFPSFTAQRSDAIHISDQ